MFQQTPVYAAADGVMDFGLRVPAVPGDDDRICRVNGPLADRLDLASAAYQGDQRLWWLMADLSDLLDPLAEIDAGLDLRFRPNGASTTS